MGYREQDPDEDPDETRDESRGSSSPSDRTTRWHEDLPLSRRTALASLIGVGGLGLAGGTTIAQEEPRGWEQDRNAKGNGLFNLGTLAMDGNPSKIADFAGANLTIDGKVLKADTWDSKVDADGNELVQIEGLGTLENDTKISDFEGSNLRIDARNVLNADQWSSNVDAGGNDLSNLGSVDGSSLTVSEVVTDVVSDNGSGRLRLEAGVDAGGNELFDIGALRMRGQSAITDFDGANLTIENSALGAHTWDTDIDAAGTSVTGADTLETNNLLVNNVGASVFSTDFQSIDGGQFQTVEFDSIAYDDQSEFTTSTHTFTPENDGAYRVESTVTWQGTGEGVSFVHRIAVDGESKATTLHPPREHTGPESTSVSKVLRLKKGDAVTIRATVEASEATDAATLRFGEDETYATFTQLG